jgi:hypothetical protein
MGLFGASKILVLILIIAAVWYGFKFIARRNQNVGHTGHGIVPRLRHLCSQHFGKGLWTGGLSLS